MKILVISAEVWRDDTNGGNVLSNLFEGMDAEFAQIYCNPGTPYNNICKKYYQMTDSMIIRNVINNKPIGKSIVFNDFPKNIIENNETEKENKRFYGFFRKYNFQTFHLIKELLWGISTWHNENLKNFIEEFDPDIIFAPCYGSHIMLSLNRYVAKLTSKPVISYISDDHYSLKHFRFSPLFWINKFIFRKNLKKTFPYYNLIYTMTDEQMKECQEVFNCNIKILRKGIDVSEMQEKRNINDPIKLIYAGGIYLGRWKTLVSIVKALRRINKDRVRMVLHIYTGNELSDKQRTILNDGVNSFLNGVISQKELKEKYNESDIALHVESIDINNKLKTRLSFSTKITDCLGSGRAVMAITWKGHSGFKYLKQENAAICIDNKKKIYNNLLKIINNPNLINEYAEKALETSKRNHCKSIINRMIESDFRDLVSEDKRT